MNFYRFKRLGRPPIKVMVITPWHEGIVIRKVKALERLLGWI